MKPCPICKALHCRHNKKFLRFTLAKVVLTEALITSAVSAFNRMIGTLPRLPSNVKIDDMSRALNICQTGITSIREELEKQSSENSNNA